jgi:serine/threonine protein phosphatase PrpC
MTSTTQDLPSDDYLLHSGSWCVQGKRSTQEDAHLELPCNPDGLLNDLGTAPDRPCPWKKSSLFAVFDGHGGSAFSNQAQLEFLGCLRDSYSHFDYAYYDQGLSFEDSIRAWLRATFALQDSKCRGTGSTLDAGTCALVALLLGTILVVANIGDCEGIVVSHQPPPASAEGGDLASEGTPTTLWKTEKLASAHKCSDPSEKQRIEELEGKVFFGRLFGQLAVSRAFGDFQYKTPRAERDFVTWEPEVNLINLDRSHRFLILACDGLWDVCLKDGATAEANRCFSLGRSPREAARSLTDLALDRGSGDNVTVMVVTLDWSGQDPLIALPPPPPPPPLLPLVANDAGPLTVEDVIASIPRNVPEAPLFLATATDATLQRSYYWLNESAAYFCTEGLGFLPELPCWVSQEHISHYLWGDSGVSLIKQTEAYHGRYFLWAPELSNVNSTFFPSPLQPLTIAVRGVEYPGAEHYYQSAKSFATVDFERAFSKIIATRDAEIAFNLGRGFKVT